MMPNYIEKSFYATSVIHMDIPNDLKYTKDHEWVSFEKEKAKVGITDFAQEALGDIVYVDLPEVGEMVKADEPVCEVESTKSVSDIYAPVTGKIIEVNPEIADMPDLINDYPYTKGWLFVIEIAQDDRKDSLLSSDEYKKLMEE